MLRLLDPALPYRHRFLVSRVGMFRNTRRVLALSETHLDLIEPGSGAMRHSFPFKEVLGLVPSASDPNSFTLDAVGSSDTYTYPNRAELLAAAQTLREAACSREPRRRGRHFAGRQTVLGPSSPQRLLRRQVVLAVRAASLDVLRTDDLSMATSIPFLALQKVQKVRTSRHEFALFTTSGRLLHFSCPGRDELLTALLTHSRDNLGTIPRVELVDAPHELHARLLVREQPVPVLFEIPVWRARNSARDSFLSVDSAPVAAPETAHAGADPSAAEVAASGADGGVDDDAEAEAGAEEAVEVGHGASRAGARAVRRATASHPLASDAAFAAHGPPRPRFLALSSSALLERDPVSRRTLSEVPIREVTRVVRFSAGAPRFAVELRDGRSKVYEAVPCAVRHRNRAVFCGLEPSQGGSAWLAGALQEATQSREAASDEVWEPAAGVGADNDGGGSDGDGGEGDDDPLLARAQLAMGEGEEETARRRRLARTLLRHYCSSSSSSGDGGGVDLERWASFDEQGRRLRGLEQSGEGKEDDPAMVPPTLTPAPYDLVRINTLVRGGEAAAGSESRTVAAPVGPWSVLGAVEARDVAVANLLEVCLLNKTPTAATVCPWAPGLREGPVGATPAREWSAIVQRRVAALNAREAQEAEAVGAVRALLASAPPLGFASPDRRAVHALLRILAAQCAHLRHSGRYAVPDAGAAPAPRPTEVAASTHPDEHGADTPASPSTPTRAASTPADVRHAATTPRAEGSAPGSAAAVAWSPLARTVLLEALASLVWAREGFEECAGAPPDAWEAMFLCLESPVAAEREAAADALHACLILRSPHRASVRMEVGNRKAALSEARVRRLCALVTGRGATGWAREDSSDGWCTRAPLLVVHIASLLASLLLSSRRATDSRLARPLMQALTAEPSPGPAGAAGDDGLRALLMHCHSPALAASRHSVQLVKAHVMEGASHRIAAVQARALDDGLLLWLLWQALHAPMRVHRRAAQQLSALLAYECAPAAAVVRRALPAALLADLPSQCLRYDEWGELTECVKPEEARVHASRVLAFASEEAARPSEQRDSPAPGPQRSSSASPHPLGPAERQSLAPADYAAAAAATAGSSDAGAVDHSDSPQTDRPRSSPRSTDGGGRGLATGADTWPGGGDEYASESAEEEEEEEVTPSPPGVRLLPAVFERVAQDADTPLLQWTAAARFELEVRLLATVQQLDEQRRETQGRGSRAGEAASLPPVAWNAHDFAIRYWSLRHHIRVGRYYVAPLMLRCGAGDTDSSGGSGVLASDPGPGRDGGDWVAEARRWRITSLGDAADLLDLLVRRIVAEPRDRVRAACARVAARVVAGHSTAELGRAPWLATLVSATREAVQRRGRALAGEPWSASTSALALAACTLALRARTALHQFLRAGGVPAALGLLASSLLALRRPSEAGEGGDGVAASAANVALAALSGALSRVRPREPGHRTRVPATALEQRLMARTVLALLAAVASEPAASGGTGRTSPAAQAVRVLQSLVAGAPGHSPALHRSGLVHALLLPPASRFGPSLSLLAAVHRTPTAGLGDAEAEAAALTHRVSAHYAHLGAEGEMRRVAAAAQGSPLLHTLPDSMVAHLARDGPEAFGCTLAADAVVEPDLVWTAGMRDRLTRALRHRLDAHAETVDVHGTRIDVCGALGEDELREPVVYTELARWLRVGRYYLAPLVRRRHAATWSVHAPHQLVASLARYLGDANAAPAWLGGPERALLWRALSAVAARYPDTGGAAEALLAREGAAASLLCAALHSELERAPSGEDGELALTASTEPKEGQGGTEEEEEGADARSGPQARAMPLLRATRAVVQLLRASPRAAWALDRAGVSALLTRVAPRLAAWARWVGPDDASSSTGRLDGKAVRTLRSACAHCAEGLARAVAQARTREAVLAEGGDALWRACAALGTLGSTVAPECEAWCARALVLGLVSGASGEDAAGPPVEHAVARGAGWLALHLVLGSSGAVQGGKRDSDPGPAPLLGALALRAVSDRVRGGAGTALDALLPGSLRQELDSEVPLLHAAVAPRNRPPASGDCTAWEAPCTPGALDSVAQDTRDGAAAFLRCLHADHTSPDLLWDASARRELAAMAKGASLAAAGAPGAGDSTSLAAAAGHVYERHQRESRAAGLFLPIFLGRETPWAPADVAGTARALALTVVSDARAVLPHLLAHHRARASAQGKDPAAAAVCAAANSLLSAPQGRTEGGGESADSDSAPYLGRRLPLALASLFRLATQGGAISTSHAALGEPAVQQRLVDTLCAMAAWVWPARVAALALRLLRHLLAPPPAVRRPAAAVAAYGRAVLASPCAGAVFAASAHAWVRARSQWFPGAAPDDELPHALSLSHAALDTQAALWAALERRRAEPAARRQRSRGQKSEDSSHGLHPPTGPGAAHKERAGLLALSLRHGAHLGAAWTLAAREAEEAVLDLARRPAAAGDGGGGGGGSGAQPTPGRASDGTKGEGGESDASRSVAKLLCSQMEGLPCVIDAALEPPSQLSELRTAAAQVLSALLAASPPATPRFDAGLAGATSPAGGVGVGGSGANGAGSGVHGASRKVGTVGGHSPGLGSAAEEAESDTEQPMQGEGAAGGEGMEGEGETGAESASAPGQAAESHTGHPLSGPTGGDSDTAPSAGSGKGEAGELRADPTPSPFAAAPTTSTAPAAPSGPDRLGAGAAEALAQFLPSPLVNALRLAAVESGAVRRLWDSTVRAPDVHWTGHARSEGRGRLRKAAAAAAEGGLEGVPEGYAAHARTRAPCPDVEASRASDPLSPSFRPSRAVVAGVYLHSWSQDPSFPLPRGTRRAAAAALLLRLTRSEQEAARMGTEGSGMMQAMALDARALSLLLRSLRAGAGSAGPSVAVEAPSAASLLRLCGAAVPPGAEAVGKAAVQDLPAGAAEVALCAVEALAQLSVREGGAPILAAAVVGGDGVAPALSAALALIGTEARVPAVRRDVLDLARWPQERAGGVAATAGDARRRQAQVAISGTRTPSGRVLPRADALRALTLLVATVERMAEAGVSAFVAAMVASAAASELAQLAVMAIEETAFGQNAPDAELLGMCKLAAARALAHMCGDEVVGEFLQRGVLSAAGWSAPPPRRAQEARALERVLPPIEPRGRSGFQAAPNGGADSLRTAAHDSAQS